MKIRHVILIMGLASAPVPTLAQSEGESSPAPQATAEQSEANVRRAAILLRSFNAALDSQEVAQQTKSQVFRCLYRNPLARISNAAGQVIANDPELDDGNARDIFIAGLRACNVRPQETGR